MPDQAKQEKSTAYGNNSKDARSWICGPAHEVRAQYIPGYTGYVSGVVAENIYAKSYSKSTAKSLAGKIRRGLE